MTKIRIGIILGIIILATSAFALDYPHFDGNGIACDSCHYVYGGEQDLMPSWTQHTPVDIDDTQSNTLCWSCHNDIEAPYTRTHSSLQIDNSYGDWTIECKVCHNPHYQKQFDTHGSASYLYSSASTTVTSNSLTESGAGWTINEYQGLVVVPNVAQKKYKYKVISNTSDTLTLQGPLNLSKISAGNTFAIIYGNLVNSTIVTPNSGSKTVKFFNTFGTNSFADGDSTYDGVCEVCHTQTTYHQNNSAGNHTHNVGTKCTTCHIHTSGFKGSGCTSCHGLPPVDAGTLVFISGGTGSATAGAHELHVTTEGFDCSSCHYDSAGSGGTHNNGLEITLGFRLFGGSIQGGSYDGQAGVSYNTSTTSPVTTVANTGAKTCAAIYCHSTGQSVTDGNDSAPVYSSPVWDDPSSAACGTCHKVTEATGLDSGSHEAHLGFTGVNGCGDCHTGAADDASSYNSSNHVNASIDVANSYTAGGAPGNGYGTCSTAACHDDGTGNPAVTPTWGSDPANCTSCHSEVPATGSHAKHVTATLYSKAECGDCHASAQRGLTPPAQHLDGNIDVYDSVSGDLGYPENKAKGTGYTTCTTVYCHSTGQSTTDGNSSTPTYFPPAWGSPPSAACGTCHKVTEASGLDSGSHASHLGTAGVDGCSNCHIGAADDASSYNSVTHVDGFIDVDNSYTADGAPGNGYGNCTTNCHGSGSPEWGTDLSTFDTCTRCHGENTASPTEAQKAPGGAGVDTNGDSSATDSQVGAHQAHMTLPSGYTNQLNSGGNCSECHKVPSAVSDSGHIDSALPAEVYPGTIDPDKADLNSVTPSYTSGTCTVYCHGASMPKGSSDGSDTAPEWNQTGYLTGAAGDNDDGSGDCEKCHGSPPNISPHTGSETLTDCDMCHQHFNDGGTLNNNSLHINGLVEAVSDCNICHAYPPAIGDGKVYQDAPVSEGKGAHATHIANIAAAKGVTLDASSDTFGAGAAAAVCGVCHTNNSSNHMSGARMINFGDGSTDYKFGAGNPVYNGVVGTSSGITPKTCSNISCHFGDSPTWQDPATAGN